MAAIEYRHSTEYTWVTSSSEKDRNRFADLDAHMKQWTDAGWALHSMSSANGGEVYMGHAIQYVFIWQRGTLASDSD